MKLSAGALIVVVVVALFAQQATAQTKTDDAAMQPKGTFGNVIDSVKKHASKMGDVASTIGDLAVDQARKAKDMLGSKSRWENFRTNCCPKKDPATFMACSNTKYKDGALQTCVGATGYDCEGVPQIEKVKLLSMKNPKSFPLVRKDEGSRKLLVTSVGSIYHDICCYHNPHGRFCNDRNTKYDSVVDGSDEENSCACSFEWRKAVWNLNRGRVWHEWYSTEKYSSDMTPVGHANSRKAWMPRGLQSYFSFASTWGMEETKATIKLKAPAMTELDCPWEDTRCRLRFGVSTMAFSGGIEAGDSAFCKHKKFGLIYAQTGIAITRRERYGICMCKVAADCTAGQMCNDGLCGPSSCKDEDDCHKGQLCKDRKCVASYYKRLGVWTNRGGIW